MGDVDVKIDKASDFAIQGLIVVIFEMGKVYSALHLS